MSYWCIFEDSSKNGTITIPFDRMPEFIPNDWDGYNKAIRYVIDDIAVELVCAEPIEVHHLPYPAHPQLNPSGCPSFCFGKEQCWGKSSCPRNHSCVD